MRAVAIATLIDRNNFGNRMQNYALQETVRMLGADRVDTIVAPAGMHHGYPPVLKAFHLMRAQGDLVVRALPTLVGRRLGIARQAGGNGAPPKSEMGRFSDDFIDYGPVYDGMRVPSEQTSVYTHFIVGSDQVWNPVFGLPRGVGFLDFAPEGTRIAYSASFGVDRIPLALHKRFRDGLNGIPLLSVREPGGRELIRDLTGRQDARVVLDPTLLQDRAFWSRFAGIESHPVASSGLAALGVLGGGPRRRQEIRGLLDPGHSGVVDLLEKNPHDGTLRRSPFDIIRHIAGADVVYTDSFHVAVFATIFGRPLRIFSRGGFNSRIAGLLEITGKDPGRFRNTGDTGVLDPIGDRVGVSINSAREGSLRFLRDALGL